MSQKNGLYLDNAIVLDIYKKINSYQTTVVDAFYEQYKNAYKLSKSNYFKGQAADAVKSYLQDGAINILTGFMDIASEMTTICQLITEIFCEYESSEKGRVEENALEYIRTELNAKEKTLENSKSELKNAINAASQYIKVTNLAVETINSQYDETRLALNRIQHDLFSNDLIAKESADELYTRIEELKKYISNVMQYCYTEDGSLIPEHLTDLTKQDWYNKSSNLELYLKLQEDPFEYCAGEVTLSEKQWAAGLCTDVFAYAGYSFLSASYEKGLEKGKAFTKAKANVLEANAYAQFTDYLSANGTAKVGYAEGEVESGWSSKIRGFKVDGKVGLVDLEGKVILGSDDINAQIKGGTKVLCADEKVAFEFPNEDGEFSIGVDASATLASADVKGGFSFLSYKEKDIDTGEKETLLGFNVGAKATAGGSFALYSESKKAYDCGFFNVNATTLKIDAAALLGLDFSVTVPTIYPKMPWDW